MQIYVHTYIYLLLMPVQLGFTLFATNAEYPTHKSEKEKKIRAQRN